MEPFNKKYLRIPDKEAESRLDKLLYFLEQGGYGFVQMAEKWVGVQKFVQVTIEIKVTTDKNKVANPLN